MAQVTSGALMWPSSNKPRDPATQKVLTLHALVDRVTTTNVVPLRTNNTRNVTEFIHENVGNIVALELAPT
jgi:hypothetical protein